MKKHGIHRLAGLMLAAFIAGAPLAVAVPALAQEPAPAAATTEAPAMAEAPAATEEAAPAPAAAADETPTIDSGDTAWMLTSTALVLLMTIPGLALFYGGMVRAQERDRHRDAEIRHHLPGDGAVDDFRLFAGLLHQRQCRDEPFVGGLHDLS